MTLNLENYETVKERKIKFYKKYEEGRIIVKNITPKDKLMEFAMFKAYVFSSIEEQEKNMPIATGYAMEIRDKDLKESKYGKKYESVNFSSWTENCEESAIGRALDNAGFSNKKCSANEIEQAEKNKKAIKSNEQPKEQDVFETTKKAINSAKKVETLKLYEEKIYESKKLTEDQKADLVEMLEAKKEEL